MPTGQFMAGARQKLVRLTYLGWLRNRDGKLSSMRVMSVISWISAITFLGVSMAMPEHRTEVYYIVVAFALAAAGTRGVQKLAEL